ncbi:centrosomal protein of 95 kDa isoform X4 [Hippocampus comes]|uniref:centrosomal protein of 95 kDa isoform X4 n=1 Tax=Hippocampus comes TaxID=109280 RepID=UPI00094EF471|nr:PREDICTED: centrosomal protein of 95 kDa isoform X4 [Hippocampus comes]
MLNTTLITHQRIYIDPLWSFRSTNTNLSAEIYLLLNHICLSSTAVSWAPRRKREVGAEGNVHFLRTIYWVDVANELLVKCRIEQKLTKLTDCDAHVFISLYENILREKVPDYIASPRSQEDDVHNVQCVIDSLSLDYLQISLSHITGENVIRGDKESIKNLLDIFDGLLEYLSEEISEESQNDGSSNSGLQAEGLGESEAPTTSNAIKQMDTKMDEGHLSSDCGASTMHSSMNSQHSINSEQPGSPSEVIGLGVSARTFTDQKESTVQPLTSDAIVTTDEVATSGPAEDLVARLSELPHTAIALQPPTQSDSPHHTDTDTNSIDRDPNGACCVEEQHDPAIIQRKTSSTEAERPVCNGLHSPAVSEIDSASQQRAEVSGETLQPTKGGPRKVLFHTQPDVLLLTLQDEASAATPILPETEEVKQEEEDLCPTTRPQGGSLHDEKDLGSWSEDDEEVEEAEDLKETHSHCRKRNRRAEKELHHIFEKLTHRIDELDQMLKRLLGNSEEPGAFGDKEEECDLTTDIEARNRTSRLYTGTPEPKSARKNFSSFSLPARGHHYVLEHSKDDDEDEAVSLCGDGQHANIPTRPLMWQSEPPRRTKHKKTVVNQAYEAELMKLEGKKRVDLDKERHEAQEAEREYREAILNDFPKAPTTIPWTNKSQPKVHTQSTSGRLRTPKKTPPLKMKENELLPVLLEELPFLHISSQDLGRMWQQQKQQVERIRAQAVAQKQRRSRFSQEFEEAQRKHDLLAGMVRKQQEHSRRLRDFKEHSQQQKSTQSRLKEQRQQIARARKYHHDYHVQHRARLMKARINEEKMFRQLFEEGLEVQKACLREQRAFATEQRLEHQKRQRDHIESMENYYKDQFSLLAEKLAQERQEIQIRKKAQEKVLLKMKRELRSKMEREIGELQKIIIQNDQDDHFQELEVQRLRNRVRMASFHCRNSCLH